MSDAMMNEKGDTPATEQDPADGGAGGTPEESDSGADGRPEESDGGVADEAMPGQS